jgi:choline dehydrogenase-like flavoprotein
MYRIGVAVQLDQHVQVGAGEPAQHQALGLQEDVHRRILARGQRAEQAGEVVPGGHGARPGSSSSLGIAARQPLAGLTAGESAPGEQVKVEERLRDWIRGSLGTALHPACTCAMGAGAAVCDPELRVRGARKRHRRTGRRPDPR